MADLEAIIETIRDEIARTIRALEAQRGPVDDDLQQRCWRHTPPAVAAS